MLGKEEKGEDEPAEGGEEERDAKKGETGVKLEGDSGGKNSRKGESGEMAGCEKNDKRTIKRR